MHRQADCRAPRYGLGPNVGRRPLVALRTPHSGREVPRTKYQVLLLTFIIRYSLLVTPASAQQPDVFGPEIPEAVAGRAVSLQFQKLGLEQGLSQSTIYDMLQDRNGFMWFGTQDGLNRYDGYEVKVFRNIPFDSTSLHEGWSMSIEEDDQGRLWVGTWEQVSVMDPVTEAFTRFRHDPENPASLTQGGVFSILQDRNGIMWFGTSNGLDRMDPSAPGEFVHFRHNPDDSTSLNHDEIAGLFEDSEGTLWVSTLNGFARFVPDAGDPGRGRFHRFAYGPIDDSFPNERLISQMYERTEDPGVLWIGSNVGLIRFQIDGGELSLFRIDSEDRLGNRVRGITPDPTNRSVLWVTVVQKGLARFDVRTQKFFLYEADPSDPHGLSDNGVRHAYTDRSGVVWVSTDRGVDRFNPASVGFEYVRSEISDPSSLAGHSVFGLTTSRDNVLWAGARTVESTGWDLIAIDRESGTNRKWRPDSDLPEGQRNSPIFGLLEDRQGAIWVGTWNGITRLHRGTGRFYRFPIDPDNPNRLAGARVLHLFQDRAGFIWVAAYGFGLHRWDPKEPDRFKRFFHN
ncbi:MAG TPA: two-component regulator propeller domain-containing protein, partial [Rhodothermia bacterium]